MAAVGWYHRDISQVVAEELLAKAGRDGSFLVRDSESVKGAYALCLLFQRHVYTYRILPDDEGLLSVQTIQGIQAKCFRTLPDLIGAYQHPNNGLVTPLLHPVHRPRPEEDSDGEDARGWGHTVPCPGAAPSSRTHIPQQLHQRLQEQVHSSPASDFMGFMAEYLTHHVQDLEALCHGHPQLRHLSTALATACRALHSEIDFTLAGLETLTRVFEAPVSPRSPAREQGFLSSDPDLELLLNKISTVNHLLSSLEKKVLKSLQETVARHNLALPSVAVAPLPAARPLAVQNFEVKLGKSQRAALTVDVESGTVTVTKRGSGSSEEVIPQDKILQLIKYQSVQSKVRLVCSRENQKSLSRDFIFPSARKREAFCQLLQLMKIQHSNLDEPEIISVYVGTWNMGSTPPPRSLASWLTSRGLGRTQDETTACIPHDIYVIGTQENSLGDREWVEFLCASLKTLMDIDYRVVALQCLWSIKMVVLVKPEHQRRISHVHTSSVKTGIANTLGNKGAVGVSFLFNGTSFGFVNCHLASGSEKTHRRNQNYSDILHSLALGDKRLAGFDLTLRFTHLFWFGDLNYRLDMDVQDILTHIVKKEFQTLLAVDQLNLEREKNKVFLRFSEGDISFPPTYRYERGTRDTYVWQKSKPTGMRINVPSWCDRILWKSHPETHVVCNSYGCTDDIVTSDHSPVFATFEVGVTSQFVPKEAPGSSPEALACIEWESIEVVLKTTSRSKCYIEFHSYCLEEMQRSGENTFQNCDIPGFLKLGWSSKHLPVLNPILPDLEYLGDQHLLLSIKGVESCESFGECCLALRSAIGSTAQQFETFLFHRGEETGSVRGWMRVRVPRGRCGTRERLYEWISFEEEDAEPAAEPPMCPKLPPQRLRSRPRSLPEPATGYTNPAYFIFEGVPNAWVAAPGEAPKKQAEGPAGGQRCRSPAGRRVPLPSEEEPWCGRPRCGPPSPSRGRPLSPPQSGPAQETQVGRPDEGHGEAGRLLAVRGHSPEPAGAAVTAVQGGQTGAPTAPDPPRPGAAAAAVPGCAEAAREAGCAGCFGPGGSAASARRPAACQDVATAVPSPVHPRTLGSRSLLLSPAQTVLPEAFPFSAAPEGCSAFAVTIQNKASPTGCVFAPRNTKESAEKVPSQEEKTAAPGVLDAPRHFPPLLPVPWERSTLLPSRLPLPITKLTGVAALDPRLCSAQHTERGIP